MKAVNYFSQENSIINVWQGSEHTSERATSLIFFNTVTNYLQRWHLCNSLSLSSYAIFPTLIVALFPQKHLTFLSKPRLIMFLLHQHYTTLSKLVSLALLLTNWIHPLNNKPSNLLVENSIFAVFKSTHIFSFYSIFWVLSRKTVTQNKEKPISNTDLYQYNPTDDVVQMVNFFLFTLSLKRDHSLKSWQSTCFVMRIVTG